MYLEGSAPYPEPAWIKTYSEFFKRRFVRDMVRCNELTDGVCLKRAGGAPHLFYKEDAASIVLDLSRITGKQGALAVDARKIYEELDLGVLDPVRHVWQAPYPSDWAIAVGPSEP